MNFGARVNRLNQSQFPIQTKPKSTKQGVNTLNTMLMETQRQKKKVLDMLAIVPLEMLEYDLLLDRLDKVEGLILQLNRQIIERGLE